MSTSPADPYAALGRAAAHAIAYRRDIAQAERTPTVDYDAIHALFDGPVPQQGENGDAIIEELATLAQPGIRASTAPRFFGWVIGNSHPTGVAADWLTAAWGQNAANVSAAPAASAVEAVAARWLLELLDLPREASIGFVTGATVANLVCLAAARSEMLRRRGWDVEADGLIGAPALPVLAGADAHATIFTALKILGLGARQVMLIDTDEQGRMIPAALETAIAGLDVPPIVIAQAGQINTGATDPFDAIAPLVAAAGGWLHVDGAFGLWAQASPTLRHQTHGIDQADSWATDGHKWLQTPYDSGFAIVRDAQAHRRAMAISASYLPPADAGQRDPSDYVIELSRRARGFATWAMIRQMGREGIAAMLEQCCAVAAHVGEALGRIEGVDLRAPVVLNQAILRFGDDAQTLAVIAAVQADAVAYVGASQWRGEWVMRVSVSSSATTMADANLAIASIARCWEAVRKGVA
ncbi:MAG: aspartate aminotransferase family protein [Sphingomonadaceae bacterium]|nr:aspartate aminotransferase family protein [Sphingomonadaceae bacterium]